MLAWIPVLWMVCLVNSKELPSKYHNLRGHQVSWHGFKYCGWCDSVMWTPKSWHPSNITCKVTRGHTVGWKFWSYRTFHLIFRRNRTYKQNLDIFHTLSTPVRTRCLAESEVLANGAAAPKWRRLILALGIRFAHFSTLYSTDGRERP